MHPHGTEIDYSAWRHVASASQFETWSLCRRKWWFQSVLQMPRQESESQKFGTTLHAVAERWLSANDLGRGDDGKPVNIYPNGWDAEVTPANADLIKSLIDKAITSGTLERKVGRKVEQGFLVPVADGVAIQGFIDLFSPAEISDHKTAKNSRYVKTAATLATNPQVLIYAKVVMDEFGGDQMRVRHNVFVRQPPKVIKIEADVTGAAVLRFWNEELTPAVIEMAAIKDRKLGDDDWRKVPGPADENSACNAYGGCPFLSVCSGHRTPSDLRDLVSSVSSGSINEPSQGTSMGIMDKLLGGSAPAVTAAPTASAPPKVAPATIAQSTPAPGASTANPVLAAVTTGTQPPSNLPVGAAPWAQATCNSCKATGFNLKTGGACFVCDSMSRSKNGPTAAQFVINVVNGIAMWRSQDGTQHGDVLLETGTAPVKTQVREALPPADAASLAAVTATESGVPVTVEPPKRGRGRPRKVALPTAVLAVPPPADGPPLPMDIVASANLGTVPPTRDEIAQGIQQQVQADAQAAKTRDESDLLDGHTVCHRSNTVEQVAALIGAPVPGERPAPAKPAVAKGFILIIGAIQMGGVGIAQAPSQSLAQIISERLAPQFTKDTGKGWFAVPVYERRDALIQRAKEIALTLSGIITVENHEGEAASLARALIPFADAVFMGVN